MNKIIKHLSEIMTRMPFYLDNLDHRDSMLWIEMMILNNILLDLVTSKVLTTSNVYKKWLDFQEQWDNILPYSYKLVDTKEYYIELIDYISQICIEEELYESAANIKKFKNFQ